MPRYAMRRHATNRDWMRRAMRTFDAGTALVVSALLVRLMPGLERLGGIEYPLLILAGSLLLPACGEMVGLYQPWRGRSLYTMLGVYALSWLTAIILISLLLVATHSTQTFSRLWMGTTALGVLGAGIVIRAALYSYLRRLRARGHNIKRVVLIGNAANRTRIHRRLEGLPYIGYRIVSEITLTEEGEGRQENEESEGSQAREAAEKQVQELARRSVFERDYDEIWLAFPLSEGERVKRVANALLGVPVDVRYFPDFSDVRLLNHRVAQVADMYSIDLNYSPLNGPMRLIKSLEDRLLGLVLFLLFLPVMLVVAVMVRWKMGKGVLFKQQRHGLDGKCFKIYKFRTMHRHSAAGTPQATHGDARITPLGALLRRTSLDELPQLYNVLQGRMSLVGPRPHATVHNDHFKDVIETYMQRHRVKPGMTGWAQVNGLRGITEDVELMRKRVEYDLYYIDNWTLGFDLKILAMTVTRGFINQQP